MSYYSSIFKKYIFIHFVILLFLILEFKGISQAKAVGMDMSTCAYRITLKKKIHSAFW